MILEVRLLPGPLCLSSVYPLSISVYLCLSPSMYLSVYQAVDQWTGNMEPHTFTTRVLPCPFKFFDVLVQSLILMDQFFLVDYPMIVVSYSDNRRLQLQNLGSTEPSGIFRQLRLSISVTSSASKLQQPPLFTNLPEVGCINMYKAFPMC